MNITENSTLERIQSKLSTLFDLSEQKLNNIEKNWLPENGTPVFTVAGKYSSQGWTEWTQGFLYGWQLLQFEATGNKKWLNAGRDNTVKYMASHVSHDGVHDHGFNNVSTYGNLLRFAKNGLIDASQAEIEFYKLALKVSGAVQASRWTFLPDNLGYVHSFNGAHSLFADTIRSMRSLMVSYLLGHNYMSEQDDEVNLLERALQHMQTTATYTVFHGENRDAYDIAGRVTHECIFNTLNGVFRCPNSQQGFSPFTTWTRGLAWIITGYAEELELLSSLDEDHFKGIKVGKEEVTKARVVALCEDILNKTCDFYIGNTPIDGIPYWDTGAPELHNLGDYLGEKSDPFNEYEPIDSSSAAIAAQGFLRYAEYLKEGNPTLSEKYFNYGLMMSDSLFSDPYLSKDENHEGLILHSIYHKPNGWDYIPEGAKIPLGESSLWGDYHAMELAVYLKSLHEGSYYKFTDCI